VKKNLPEPCPCGSGAAYEHCCGRWHRGEPAPGAEALMRSRYSAYVMEDEPYLLATWHAGARPGAVEFEAGTKWLGLTVKGARELGPDEAEVRFVARYRVGGRPAVRLEERSRFVREAGRWFYVEAMQGEGA
jgi:SEC-C motif-containing protein